MRQLATIQTIEDLQPIEGADQIEKARVKDWWIVVKKGQFAIGDMCVFFEIDSFLPDIELYAFLKKGSTLKRLLVDGVERVGIRLKTIKLRGQLSQGLVLPLSDFYAQPGKDHGYFSETMPIEVGMDVSEVLNVLKYEPPIPAQLAGKVKGFFPVFIPKTDEERIQNMGDVLHGFYVTEKLDGTSVTYYKRDGVFGVCSRNLELLEGETTQWRLAKQLELATNLFDGFAFQGELVGEGIQGNSYKIPGHKVYFYNVYDINRGCYMNFEDFTGMVHSLGLETVPILDDNFSLPNSVEAMLKYAEGKSALNPDAEREGVVVRSKAVMFYKDSRLSFKAISNKFLLNEE